MRVAAIQYDIAWEDKPVNHDRVRALLAEVVASDGARPDGETLVVLPEMGDTGFSFALDRIADDATHPWASSLAREFGVYLQVGDAVRGPDGRGRNRAALIGPDGTLLGTYEKIFPFSYGREIEHFDGGEHLLVRPLSAESEAIVAPFICYDLRFPEVWRLAARAGANLFTIGANWPSARQQHWRTLLIARAIENQAFVVAANRTGADPHLAYAGGSIIVSPHGEVLAEGGPDEGVIVAEIDPGTATAWRREFPALRDSRPDLLGTIAIETGN